MFLQDGDQSQNSKVACMEMEVIGAECFKIPPSKICGIIDLKIKQDAMERNITREDFENFSGRVKKTMEEYPSVIINKIL